MISFELLKHPVKKEVLLTLWWQSMILLQIFCCFSIRELDTLLTPCRLCCLCGGNLIFLSLAQWNVSLKDHANCHRSWCPLHKAKAIKQILYLLQSWAQDWRLYLKQNHRTTVESWSTAIVWFRNKPLIVQATKTLGWVLKLPPHAGGSHILQIEIFPLMKVY